MREIATIVGVSPATISRIEKGIVPDVATFLAICDWLEMPLAELIRNMHDTKNLDTCHSVCAKLRTDKRLDPEVANAIAVLIEFAYNYRKYSNLRWVVERQPTQITLGN